MKKRGLGRGLDALLGAASQPDTPVSNMAAATETTGANEESRDASQEVGLCSVDLDAIQPSRFQPRREFDQESLQELADSISARGVIQPVVVRPLPGGGYELIAGERRWRAARLAGLAQIPAILRDDVDDQAAMAMALIENIQRRDLNPLEEAMALHRLLHEYELTHQQVAEAVGKSRSSVTNLLRVLEMNEDVREHLQQRRIDLGHAKALLGLQGPRQSEAADQVVLMGLSVRETEKLVRGMLGVDQPKPPGDPVIKPDPDVQRMLTDLSDKLGAKVDLKQNQSGKGKLTISYNSLDELDGILAHIR